MAIRIQRAWRKYKTRQILKKISGKRVEEQHIFHMLDEFTDQEVEYEGKKEEQLQLGLSGQQYFSGERERQYEHLVRMISQSLQEKDLSKEECLKKILSYLNFPEQYEVIPVGKKDEAMHIEENSEQNSSMDRLPHSVASQSNDKA